MIFIMKKNKEITSIIMYLKNQKQNKTGKTLKQREKNHYLFTCINNKKYLDFFFFSFQVRNYGLYKNIPSVNGQVHERLLVVSV